jgi:AcrR family transcriptional regulator
MRMTTEPYDHSVVRWRRRKDARPQELLDAAFAVFVDKGFADARLDDIAAKAGVSKGTIYLYFDSKETMFQEMIRRVADAKTELIGHMVEAHQGSFAALLRQLATFMAAQVSQPPLSQFPRLIIGESRRFPELAAFYFETAIARARAILMRIIERGQASGEFRAMSPRHAAHIFISPMLFVPIYTSVFSPHESEPFDLDGHLAAHLDIVLGGLCATGGKPCAED